MGLISFVAFALVAQSALAQIDGATLKEEAKQSEKTEFGWKKKLILGGSLSMGSSDNVIGQPDGETNTFGFNIDGQLNRVGERDEWRNSVKIGESATRTPAIPRYTKVSDELKLETLYLHTLESTPWFGPYAKASVETAIFKGEDIRAEPTTYEFFNSEDVSQGTVSETTLRLTDGFRPLTTKESVGGFFKILTQPTRTLEARAGLGAIQVEADDQRVIKGKTDAGNIKVVQLESYDQVGIEGGFAFKGTFDDKTSYSLEGEFLSPVVTKQKAGDDRSKFELTNWELKGRLTSKIYDWLSLDYTAKVFKQPQLLDKTQAQTLLLLSLTYQLL